jgi:hypothetical protein
MSEYLKVGQPIDPGATVYQLVLSDFLTYVDPKEYGMLEEKGVDPNYYFITSGDAVEKTKILDKDLWRHAGDVRKNICEMISKKRGVSLKEAMVIYKNKEGLKDFESILEYEKQIWVMAGKARALLNNLIKIKGDNCFLETEWESHRLLCIIKNPRN